MMTFSRKEEDTSSYIPTLNRMGYMSPTLDKIQAAFVTYCARHKGGYFLDIGCGFGVATLPVIQKGCKIVACDLEESHLDILKKKVPKEALPLLTLMKGHFPNDIVFPENSFDAINMSMVLHFLSPIMIEKTFKEIFFCLKKGGRLFITTSSPYQRVLLPFISIYEKKRLVEEWPGYIHNIANYVPHRARLLPKKNIVFCVEELKRLASKFGFHVRAAAFFSRDGIPPDLRLDGREYSGLICEKPRDSSSAFLEKSKAIRPTQAANIR